MKNKEKFNDEIFEIACRGSRIAVSKKTGKPISCSDIICSRCLFNPLNTYGSNCTESCKKWGEEEYEEPPIDWSKVPIDTPILVRNSEYTGWYKRHFAKYEDGIIYVWGDGGTSWSTEAIVVWNYAKLAESEEE